MNATESKTMIDIMHDQDLRIGRIIWMAGSAVGFSDDEFFEDTLRDAIDREPHSHPSMAVFAQAPDWVECEHTFIEWNCDAKISGFVARVETPVAHSFTDISWKTSGFGHYATTDIYVTDMAELVPLAVAWRAEMHKKWREKEQLARAEATP